MKVRQYLRISMRHFRLTELTDHDYQDMLFTARQHFDHLGECVYTLNTSNFAWPIGVSYPEMRRARSDILAGLSR